MYFRASKPGYDVVLEFSKNDFSLNSVIQRIMTESKNGQVTTVSTKTLPAFPLLPIVRHLLPLPTLNNQSKKWNFFTATFRNMYLLSDMECLW